MRMSIAKDKPASMAPREWISRVLSERDNIPLSIIEKVTTHSYDGASSALNNNNSIEVSGFGKFIFNEKRAKYTLKKFIQNKEQDEKRLEDEDLSEAERLTYTKRVRDAEISINLLKTKL